MNQLKVESDRPPSSGSPQFYSGIPFKIKQTKLFILEKMVDLLLLFLVLGKIHYSKVNHVFKLLEPGYSI